MARKRLNKNLVIGLTLFVFLVMIAAAALMLHQLRMGDPRHFLELARRYEGREQWKQAALFYKKAAERSHDASHLVSLGNMLLNDGEVRQALQVWRSALVDQPNLVEAHLRVLDVLLELAQLYGGVPSWIDVQGAAQTLLDLDLAKPDATTALARHALGLALVNLPGQDAGNAEQGLTELRKACALAPDSVDYALDLAGELAKQNAPEEGLEIYRHLLETHQQAGADAAKARWVYAAHLASENKADEAARLFEESLALALPNSASLQQARLEYAKFLSRQWAQLKPRKGDSASAESMFEKSESLLRSCIAFDPDDFDAYAQLATLTKASGHDEETLKIAQERLDLGLSRKGLKALRHQFRAFQLMLLASEACVSLSIQQVDQPDVRDEWLAKARSFVADAKGEFPNEPRVLAQSARVLRAAGQDRPALEEFHKALLGFRAVGAIDWRTIMDTARLHLLLGEPGAALELMEEVAGQATTTSFLMLYAQTLFQNEEWNKALAVADRILGADPNYSEARNLKAAIYDRQGRSGQAANMIESPVLRAMLEAREQALDGDREGAIGVLKSALQEHPSDLRLVQVTVAELLNMDRVGEARAVVEAALKAKPDEVLFKKLSVLTQPELSDEQREQQLLTIVNAEDDAYQRAWDLIDVYARRENLSEVINAADAAESHLLQKDTPLARQATISQHRALLQVKLRAAAELHDDVAMEAARNAAVKYDVDGAQGQSVVALYHLYHEDFEPAIQAFQRALEQQPSDARSLTHLGQCLLQVERPEVARLYFERALRINHNDPWAHRGLAMIAKQTGDQAVYETEMAFCKSRMPSDPWVRSELLAEQDQADPAAAIARREALLAENPGDSANLKQLAQLCETTGQFDKADKYLTQLLDLHPNEQSVVAAVAKYYRSTNRPDRSLALVRQFADSRATPEEQAEAQVLVAAHYLALGKPDLVETTLLAAADQADTLEVSYGLGEFYLRSMDRPEKALPWFDRAVEVARKTDSTKLPKIMATRISCLLDRGLNDLKTARARADELAQAFPDDPLSYLWQSEVSAREGEIDAAIDSLAKYLNRNPDAAYPRFQRAQYYVVEGRTAQAIEDLESIKQLDRTALQGKPRLLLAQLHNRAGHVDEAVRELESLTQDLPDSLEAHQMLVSAYLDQGRFADAERLVTARINRAGDTPDARWLFLRGQICLRAGEYEKAYADFDRGVELTDDAPESLMLILELHLRTGRFSEGVEYYRAHPARKRTAGLVARYARLLAKTNQTDESADAFAEAMTLALSGSTTDRRAVTQELSDAFADNDSTLKDAIALFQRGRAQSSTTDGYDRILARLYRMAGNMEAAAELLDRLIKGVEPGKGLADLLVEQAELYEAQGDAERARARYEQAIKYDDRNWVALNNVAYLLSDKLGRSDLALPYARKAVALMESADTLDTLGWIYVAGKDYTLGVAELSRAVRLAPDSALSNYHLGEAFRRLGRFADAQRALEQSQELARHSKSEGLTDSIKSALEKVTRSDSTSDATSGKGD